MAEKKNITKADEAAKREEYLKVAEEAFVAYGEDIGRNTDGSFVFPIVINGENSWAELKIVIHSSWGDDEGFEQEATYSQKQVAKAEKAKAAASGTTKSKKKKGSENE